MEEHFSGNGKEKGLTHLPQTVMLDFQSHSTKYFLFYFILFIKKLSEIIILQNLVKKIKRVGEACIIIGPIATIDLEVYKIFLNNYFTIMIKYHCKCFWVFFSDW